MSDLTIALQRKVQELEERVLQLEEINTSVLQEVLEYLKQGEAKSKENSLLHSVKDKSGKFH